MKKLFFYLMLYAFIFWSAFCLTEEYFSWDTAEPDAIGRIAVEVQPASVGTSAFPKTTEAPQPVATDSICIEPNYCVTFRNHMLVILDEANDTVYESTGLTEQQIRITDSELYNRIIEGIHFTDKQEIYNFLESISS